MLGDTDTSGVVSIKFEVVYYCFGRQSWDVLAVKCATKAFHGLIHHGLQLLYRLMYTEH